MARPPAPLVASVASLLWIGCAAGTGGEDGSGNDDGADTGGAITAGENVVAGDLGARIESYAVAPGKVYVIAGQPGKLFVCPDTGCSVATATQVAPGDTRQPIDVAVSTAGVTWLTQDAVRPGISTALLDGTQPRPLDALSAVRKFEAPVRALADRTYIPYVDATAGKAGVVELAPDGTSSAAEQASPTLTAPVFAVTPEWNVIWHRAPQLAPSNVVATARARQVTLDVTTATDIPVDGIAVYANSLFWVDTNAATQTKILRACQIDRCAASLVTVADKVGPSIAVSAQRLFYTVVPGKNGELRSCGFDEAMMAKCAPRIHASGIAWVSARRLRVEGKFVYGLDQNQTGLRRASAEQGVPVPPDGTKPDDGTKPPPPSTPPPPPPPSTPPPPPPPTPTPPPPPSPTPDPAPDEPSDDLGTTDAGTETAPQAGGCNMTGSRGGSGAMLLAGIAMLAAGIASRRRRSRHIAR